MLVKLSQLPGPTLLGHLALGPCHGPHQQCQVTQDLTPLGLVLGEQAVSRVAPGSTHSSAHPGWGSSTLPVPPRVHTGIVWHFWCLCQPKGSFSSPMGVPVLALSSQHLSPIWISTAGG